MSVGSGCAEGAEQAVYGSYDTGNFKGNSLFESCPGYYDIIGHVAQRSPPPPPKKAHSHHIGVTAKH